MLVYTVSTYGENSKSVAVAMAMAGSDFFELVSGSSSSSDDESKVSRRSEGKEIGHGYPTNHCILAIVHVNSKTGIENK